MMKVFNKLKERIKGNFKENKVLLIVFVVIWAILVVFILNKYDNTLGKKSSGVESYDRSVIEINKENYVEAIVPIENNSESVSIMLATYARDVNKGNITINIRGVQTGKEYANEVINVKNVEDNAYHSVKLNEVLNIKQEKRIKIKVTSDSEVGQGVGIYYSNTKYFELASSFSINGKDIENTDLMTRFLINDNQFSYFSKLVIIWSIIGLTLLALILLLINPKQELMIALMVFIMGLIFMIIIVPMSPPDEQTHYEISLRLSNIIMGKKDELIDYAYYKYGSMYGHYNISAGYLRFMDEINKPLNLTGKLVEDNLHSDIFYFGDYIPQALGITLGRLLNLNMITTFYTGRMFNLIFYTLCVYFAIKKAPSFKLLIGIIAIMPMQIQTAASLSYDVFINGLSFLMFAYFIKLFFIDEKITIKEYIILFIICLLLAPAKVVYGLFVFLFWFVPTNRYKNKTMKILLTILLCLPTCYQLFDIAWGPLQSMIHSLSNGTVFNTISASTNIDSTSIRKLGNNDLFGNNVLKEEYGFSYIVKHPLETLEMFVRTIRYRIKFWFYGSLGRELSGGTLILPLGLVYSLVGITLVSVFVKNEYTFSISMKVLKVLISITIGLMIMVGFFVTWTDSTQVIVDDYGGKLVEGIQGRYFVPILPYFFTIFANKKISIPKKLDKYILLSYICIFFVIVVYVLSYTFVN